MLKQLHESSLAAGRKYRMSLICLLVLSAGLAATAITPALVPVFSTFTGGVVGVLAVYCGGNVGKTMALRNKEEKTNGEDLS